ncbi:MAG TPA: AAA domain-containing protein [Candidatus Methylomirabilis sp.]|nr:AAA domain-containing protein [Candidatus Methylomirabilis sp.]
MVFNLQSEMAKAFVIALEGELKVAEQNKESYYFHEFTRVISGGRVLLKGICSGTPPRKGAMIVPMSTPDENMLKVEDIAGPTVILSSSGISDIKDTIFTEAPQNSNFEKMAAATREMGMSPSLHARVLLGNEPLPQILEIKNFEPFKQKLNKYQFSAVVMSLTHQLSLVQGPPGTGKTLVAAELALHHIKQGRKVLLVAKTNKAADIMISALINLVESTSASKDLLDLVLRLGVEEKIAPSLRKYTLQSKLEAHARYPELRDIENEKDNFSNELENTNNGIKAIDDFINSKPPFGVIRVPITETKKIRLKSKVEEIQHELLILNTKSFKLRREIAAEIIGRAPVIVATAYQCPRPELKEIMFDAVIFDESSQAMMPEAAMALVRLKSDGFLTVIGDHKQLGPIVMSEHSMLKVSLYGLLYKRIKEHDMDTPPNKKAMLSLRRQYRMHPEIAEICRMLSYPEGLETADIDRILRMDTSRLNGCWQDQVIDPGKSVVFVSTEDVATQETKDRKGSTLNLKEVEIIEDIVKRLEELGVLPRQISIISAYKAQRELISSRMQRLSVGTVDSFQGDENDVVIFDITRDNLKGAIGFMKDARRLNVAVSRARRKLIIVGNRKSLGNHVKNQVFLKFLKAVSKNTVVIPAPDITDEEIFVSCGAEAKETQISI